MISRRGGKAVAASQPRLRAGDKAAPFYKKARDELERAITLDEQQDYDIALHRYIGAVEYSIAGYKRDTSSSRKNKMYVSAKSYVERAETVKRLAANSRGRSKKRAPVPEAKSSRSKTTTSTDDICFDDIKGLDGAKMALYESVILPQTQPQVFVGARKPFKGILLYGPPGTGKTMLAKALANEAKCSFISVSASEIFGKYQGESEKAVKDLFEQARAKTPCVVFIGEVDSVGRSRDQAGGGGGETEGSRRVKTELMRQLDGVGTDNTGVLFLGATNTPWEIDSALRRRFEKRIMVSLPNAAARLDILKSCLGDEPVNLSSAALIGIAARLEGYSSADVSMVVREALMEPVRKILSSEYFKEAEVLGQRGLVACEKRDRGAKKLDVWSIDPDKLLPPVITAGDFEVALRKMKATVTSEDLENHTKFANEFGGGTKKARVESSPHATHKRKAPPSPSTLDRSTEPKSTPGLLDEERKADSSSYVGNCTVM